MGDASDDDGSTTPPWGYKSEPRRRIQHDTTPAHNLAVLARAARDTSDTSMQTLDRVSALRLEIMGHLKGQDGYLEGLEGKLDMIIREVELARHEQSKIRVASMQAKIEVEKTGEIARIDEAKAAAEHRRKRTLQVLAIVGPIISAIIAALAAGGCP